jgi:hypothetical protein
MPEVKHDDCCYTDNICFVICEYIMYNHAVRQHVASSKRVWMLVVLQYVRIPLCQNVSVT